MLPHLPRALRAIAPTQRGHGGTGRPAQGYTPADFAADAVALLDALGMERAIVVGHSMGSQIALRLALDHPGRVHGLVLIGGFAALRRNAAVRDALGRHDARPCGIPWIAGLSRDSSAARSRARCPRRFSTTVVRESLKVPAPYGARRCAA